MQLNYIDNIDTDWAPPESGVNELSIILIYATWCPHSRAMLPDYIRVKSELDGETINNTEINIIMYDIDVDTDEVNQYDVSRYPSLFVERDGVRETFQYRSYNNIIGYIESIVGPIPTSNIQESERDYLSDATEYMRQLGNLIDWDFDNNSDVDYSSPEDYSTIMVKYHNNIRQQCSDDNKTIRWNQNLANYADNYAKQLANENNCNMSHSFDGHNSYEDRNAGENLSKYADSSGDINNMIVFTTRMAINGWAGEGYGPGSPGESLDPPMTGHYTAMNWRDTEEVGCGYGITDDNTCIIHACNYTNITPNIIGQYDEQVLCTDPYRIIN